MKLKIQLVLVKNDSEMNNLEDLQNQEEYKL